LEEPNTGITVSKHRRRSVWIVRAALTALYVAVAAATACGIASGAPRAASVPPRFVVSQVRASLVRAKDPRPISALFVLTRRQAANKVLSGASVHSNQSVYVVVVKGSFTVVRPGPNASGFMHVAVLNYVFDARTGRETDGGFGRALPDLTRLGRVRNLLPYLRHG
jgi:hypothetical protein